MSQETSKWRHLCTCLFRGHYWVTPLLSNSPGLWVIEKGNSLLAIKNGLAPAWLQLYLHKQYAQVWKSTHSGPIQTTKNNRNFLVAIYVSVYMYTCSPATLKALSFHPVQKLGPLAIPIKQPQTVKIKSICLSASLFLIGMMLSFPINTNKYCIQTMPLPATRWYVKLHVKTHMNS